MFPSPHPGIINFFSRASTHSRSTSCFRPLIRGLSISSYSLESILPFILCFRPLIRGLSISSNCPVAVISRCLCFRPLIRGLSISSTPIVFTHSFQSGFRPLIRGLSISSRRAPRSRGTGRVSVPSSGDYQFLRTAETAPAHSLPVSVPSSGDYQFLLFHLFSKRVEV